MTSLRMRQIEIVAQDPSVRKGNRILTAWVSIPYEELDPGPKGYAVHVVDYDSTTQTMYRPAKLADLPDPPTPDDRHHAPPSAAAILGDPEYHAINAYALVMLTLHRFEFALGRRVAWGTQGPQLKVVPHAFEVANAFYSEDAEALLFGYVRSGAHPTFLGLSHDIVVHETTHALIDGLRDKFTAPSSPDQAALHEGLADVVALLSVFALKEVVGHFIDGLASAEGEDLPEALKGYVSKTDLTRPKLKQSVFFGLAEEMRGDARASRVNALRRSIEIDPDPNILNQLEFREPHRRGEVLVAAILRAFLEMWVARLRSLGSPGSRYVSADRVAEEGVTIADLLLTTVIRAIDYTPPIHIEFGDYLSAMLTADQEVRTDDSRYGLREHLRTSFADYGIKPASGTDDGTWNPPSKTLASAGVHLGSLQTDTTEMFRLIWANRADLRLDRDAFTRIASLRPCFRVSPDDGSHIRETVVECTQYLKIQASRLDHYGLKRPVGMDLETEVVLEGGSTLVLDEYGRLKFEIYNPLPNARQDAARLDTAQRRLDYLWNNGFLDRGNSLAKGLAAVHRGRTMGQAMDVDQPVDPRFDERGEQWI